MVTASLDQIIVGKPNLTSYSFVIKYLVLAGSTVVTIMDSAQEEVMLQIKVRIEVVVVHHLSLV